MEHAAGPKRLPDETAAPTSLPLRIETVSTALAAIKNLIRQSDPEAERQLIVLAEDMEVYLADMKRRADQEHSAASLKDSP